MTNLCTFFYTQDENQTKPNLQAQNEQTLEENVDHGKMQSCVSYVSFMIGIFRSALSLKKLTTLFKGIQQRFELNLCDYDCIFSVIR